MKRLAAEGRRSGGTEPEMVDTKPRPRTATSMEASDRSARSPRLRLIAGGSHFDHFRAAEDTTFLVTEEFRHRVRIDSGHRDVGADAEHHERQQQKHKTALQVAVLVGLTSLH